MTGLTRGYGFITYCDKEAASEAVSQLHNHEIRPGKQLKVNISIANVRLFVGNIPKNKSKEEIKEEFGKRKLQAGHPKFWQCDVIVDWADPMEEPDDDTMS